MFVKIKSATNLGLETIGVDVEVNIANKGLPSFDIVGLPSKSVDESKERVKTAIINSKIEFPLKKIIVNLAPADIPKEGSCYDLPMAVGILASVINCEIPKRSLFFGELSLDGTLRHTKGSLLLSLFAKERGIESIFVPKASANEAAIIKGVNVYPVENLNQLLAHLLGQVLIEPAEYIERQSIRQKAEFDMKEILGQEQTKRAAEIAAAGGHNLFMVGSPGAGKTMLARAFPGILPQLQEKESLEVTKIYSASGNIPPDGSVITVCPFRSPHHTISQVGLVGGGSRPQPGEISLAHRGVLFLDEFTEFPRYILESLRQPMEDGHLTISRSRAQVKYPSRFMLIASANPCPCGYLYHPKKACSCTEREVKKYRKKISGPILDRIDLHVEVPVVDANDLSDGVGASPCGCPSIDIRKRVIKAREIQNQRFMEENIFINAEMKNEHIKKYCFLSSDVKRILAQAVTSFHLSARSYFKMIKVARTIADLSGASDIEISHMAEALQYRSKQSQES
ncbi:YifB family Mg chelatase-like AAA ATPase [Patescibacteria group bacterium]|nr:YifB family Mg chelatase-like AAA ATPase [Patescibacteria group bacterium]